MIGKFMTEEWNINRCKKCGDSNNVAIQLHEDARKCRIRGFGSLEDDGPTQREHLHLKCRCCGYYWAMEPLDKKLAQIALQRKESNVQS